MVELQIDFRLQLRQGEQRRVAAHEFIFCMGARMAVQQRLPHRELVEIGLQQTAHDRRQDENSGAVRDAISKNSTTESLQPSLEPVHFIGQIDDQRSEIFVGVKSALDFAQPARARQIDAGEAP